jgi:hypothetical protein
VGARVSAASLTDGGTDATRSSARLRKRATPLQLNLVWHNRFERPLEQLAAAPFVNRPGTFFSGSQAGILDSLQNFNADLVKSSSIKWGSTGLTMEARHFASNFVSVRGAIPKPKQPLNSVQTRNVMQAAMDHVRNASAALKANAAAVEEQLADLTANLQAFFQAFQKASGDRSDVNQVFAENVEELIAMVDATRAAYVPRPAVSR